MADTKAVPYPIVSLPGIKRDGTRYEGDYHVDGQWVRWQRGLPRKMAGYRQMASTVSGIARGINGHPANGLLYTHIGSQDKLERMTINVNTNVPSSLTDRTPVGFVTSANNMWSFAQMYDASASFTAGNTYILAHAAPNASDLSSDTEGSTYYGDIEGTAVLSAISGADVSGGCVALFPYFFVFGSDGYVRHSVANQPTNMTGSGSNQARVTSKKIIKGLPLRGGAANSPAGLLWSLDAIIKVSFVGGNQIFSYDALSNQNGILGQNTVVEHDSIYYWAGQGRFMVFNGVVQELENKMNRNFFFDNLNWTYRNKCYAFKVPAFSEIWWCFPYGSATECDHAVVYNINERTWYDTALPNGGRSAAENIASYRFPLLGGSDTVSSESILWQHETGVDEVTTTSSAIQSYYETADISLPGGGAPQNRALTCEMIEPDFVQTGDMICKVTGRANAKSVEVVSAPRTIYATPTEPHQQVLTFHGDALRREMRFYFESNTLGGDYQAGKSLAHIKPADGTVLGGVS